MRGPFDCCACHCSNAAIPPGWPRSKDLQHLLLTVPTHCCADDSAQKFAWLLRVDEPRFGRRLAKPRLEHNKASQHRTSERELTGEISQRSKREGARNVSVIRPFGLNPDDVNSVREVVEEEPLVYWTTSDFLDRGRQILRVEGNRVPAMLE